MTTGIGHDLDCVTGEERRRRVNRLVMRFGLARVEDAASRAMDDRRSGSAAGTPRYRYASQVWSRIDRLMSAYGA